MLRNVPLLPTRDKILHFSRHAGCGTLSGPSSHLNKQNIVKLSFPYECSFYSTLNYCLIRNTHRIQEANTT